MGTSQPGLILERCAQAIETAVIPHVADGFASAQAGLVATLLHMVAPTVEEKSRELMQENQGMREVLTKVAEALRGEKALSSNAVSRGLIEIIEFDLRKVETDPFDISGENKTLKGTLVKTIQGLDALKNDVSPETMSSLKQQIRSILRQQIDHAVAHVGGRQTLDVQAPTEK